MVSHQPSAAADCCMLPCRWPQAARVEHQWVCRDPDKGVGVRQEAWHCHVGLHVAGVEGLLWRRAADMAGPGGARRGPTSLPTGPCRPRLSSAALAGADRPAGVKSSVAESIVRERDFHHGYVRLSQWAAPAAAHRSGGEIRLLTCPGVESALPWCNSSLKVIRTPPPPPVRPDPVVAGSNDRKP